MFQLIISMVALAIAAVLSVVSIYYEGSAFSHGELKIQLGRLLNGGQNIAAAEFLFAADNNGQFTESMTDLTTNSVETYLSDVPDVPTNFGPWIITTTGASSEIEIVEVLLKDNPTRIEEFCQRVAIYANGTVYSNPAADKFYCDADMTHFVFRIN